MIGWQGDKEDLLSYYKQFVGLVEVVENVFGVIQPVGLATRNVDYGSKPDEVMKAEREKLLAAMFLDGANKKKFGIMLNNLQTDHALGSKKYPDNLESALQVLTLHWEQRGKSKGLKKNLGEEESPSLSFAETHSKGLKCWKCGKKGHKKMDCPETDGVQEETNNLTYRWTI